MARILEQRKIEEELCPRMNTLLTRARSILREEGVISLIRKALLFLMNYINAFVGIFFRYQTICIYEKILDEIEPAPLKVEDFDLRIVSVPEQIDELLAAGFDLSFHSDMETHRERLDKGGILIYGFLGRKLVHTNWIALTKEANFDPYPFEIDWQHEACLGPSFTMSEHRGMGINAFVYSEMFRILKEKGYSKAKFTIAKSNIEHRKSQAKIGSEITGTGGLLKILRWTFWIEKPTKWIRL